MFHLQSSNRRLRGFFALSAALWGLGLWTPLQSNAEPPLITLPQALEKALGSRPEIEAFASDLRASQGRVLQASLRPNPELGFEIANLEDETSVTYSQPLEMGGKRQARVAHATAAIGVLQADYARVRLDISAEVKRAYVSLLGAQMRLELQREAHELAAKLATTVADRVAAGATSPIEATRARVTLSAASAEVERARRQLEEARLGLSAAMGDPSPGFSQARGELREDLPLLDAALSTKRLAANPDLTRWDEEKAQRSAALTVERSLALSDLTVSGGLSYVREDKAGVVTLGLSVPLPLFHKNQGAIQESEAALTKVVAERRGAEARARSQLAQSLASLASSTREARILREETLAGAREAFETVNEGYRLGKFPYLDVLDAGQALIEARLQHLDALVSLNLSQVDVERLVGEPAQAAASPDRKN
ncbi:MAG: TolC family protein [Deltaproteobacteria bacterium]|nr:TolC family protein [Deltaproteobacteria bacterium]